MKVRSSRIQQQAIARRDQGDRKTRQDYVYIAGGGEFPFILTNSQLSTNEPNRTRWPEKDADQNPSLP